ncbi:hypothetical protein K501DRAFT_337697 [Backusella circina FSU 941]|nr:hypothetical protein K501DRAFT_337697 [Backusella circina FSU 941]
MGLLKLGSIYKKSKSKKEKPETPPLPSPPPTLEPLALNLDLNLSSTRPNTTVTKQSTINNDSFMNTPATSPQPQNNIASGSLFDDIFSELNPNNNGTPKDELQSDISLALALSNQLSINSSAPSSSGAAQNGNKNSNGNTNGDRKEVSNFLLGDDSIYSSYLRNLSSLDNNDTTASNTSDFSTSMFASMMGPTPQQSRSQITRSIVNNSPPPLPVPSAPATTKTVLDSDISDSDDSKMSDDDSDTAMQQKITNSRMTKGMQPIMERRPQDHHLLVQRKIDNWSNRVDPEANKVESREAIISRMKDRHRNEVKMAALRQQQQQQQQSMMGMHMVPQVYGAPPPILPHSQPIVSPHPGMMRDPYAALPPQQAVDPSHHPFMQQQQQQHPEFDHPAMYPTHSKSTSRTPNASTSTVQTPPTKPVSSKSTPTSNSSSTTNLSVSSSASSVMSNASLKKSKKLGSVKDNESKQQKQQKKSNGSSKNKKKKIEEKEEIVEEEEQETQDIDQLSSPGSSSFDTTGKPFHSLDDPDEADVESSGEDDEATVLRKKKSIRKLRQKQQQQQEEEEVKHVRNSRSTPNLKKKQSKKSKSSRSSSRRNSQDASFEEHLPRSQSHNTNISSSQHHHPPIRHLKSESDLRQKRAGPSHHLNYEWERMQAYQREQQLKHQHKFNQQQQQQQQQQQHQQQQGFSPQVIYAPVYYPTTSSPMPYSPPMDNFYQQYDPRASAMAGYGYPPPKQPYYTR